MKRRAVLVLSLMAMLVFATSAWAVNTYGPTTTWHTNDSAQSNYNTSYWENMFGTNGNYQTTVTFIYSDSSGYHWAGTSNQNTYFNRTTWPLGSQSRSMYCIYRDQFSTTGSCYGD
jgi:hypothetical protein